MDESVIIGFSSLASLIIVNIICVAYGYGKLNGRVDSLAKKIDNGFTCKFHATIENELGRIQGELKAGRGGGAS